MTLLALPAAAEAPAKRAVKAHVRVEGRERAIVTSAQIRLGDIAHVYSDRNQDDEAVIALKKIVLAKAPAPGKSSEVAGLSIVDRMREEGVRLTDVIYTFPQSIGVTRAGRKLNDEEIRAAIESSVSGQNRDTTLKRVFYRGDFLVAPGDVQLSARQLGPARSGAQVPFELIAKQAEGESLRHTVSAEIAEWREVPVANRALGRGSLIGPDDIVMARLNIAALPKDALPDMSRIVGLELKREVGEGTAFKAADLAIPPVIQAGAKVTMRYRTDLFEATATGVALESGIAGQEIKVRNEHSKKVVIGTVIEPGLVGVK